MGTSEATLRASARVSVVIPAYNAEATIGVCLERLAQQTLQPCEIILVDDSSSDRTVAIAAASPFPVTVIRQAHADASAARNAGAARATGEFILFCDADVVLVPDAVERFVAALAAASGAAFAYSSFIHGSLTFHAPAFSVKLLRRRNFINTTSLIRRKDVIPFDTTLARFQDWDFFLSLAARGKAGVAILDVLFESVMRGTGKSSRGFFRWFRAYQAIRRKHHLPLDLWSVFRQIVYQLGK